MSATETIHQASAVVPRPWRLEGSGLRIEQRDQVVNFRGNNRRDRRGTDTTDRDSFLLFIFF